MPGTPFEHAIPGFFSDSGTQEVRMNQGTVSSATHTGFLVWLVVIGVIIPVAILGGLRLGGFSFVYKHR